MSRPLALYVLQKLGAPRAMGRPILLPVEHKLWNNLLRKLAVYIGHMQNIIDRFFWLPLGWNSPRHTVLIHHTSIKLPLAAHMLDKF